jgi:branched-chain amino acid transport system substrate-binding protein
MEEKIMKNKFILSLCILILAVMFSASCFAAEKILFAFLGPLTGDSAAEGIQMLNGTELAVKEINESGGVNGKEFEYIVGDDVANPNQAVIIAQKFSANKDILFVLGPNNSSCAISSLPTWEKVGLPLISPVNTNPTITRLGHKNYFRIIANDDIMINQLSKLAVIELGFKNLAVIWENSDYGIGMRDIALKAIPELGAKILGNESYVPAVDRDYSSQITKFKGAGVDCVLFLGEYTASALFLMQSVNLGFNAKVLGSSGCANPKVIEIAGETSEDFYAITAFDPNDKRPKQAKFIKSFQTVSKDKPGECGAHAYDIVYMVKKAIEMGGTTREKLIEVLHRSDFEYDGVTGLIKFDEYGDVFGKKSIALKVKGGEFITFVPTKF